MKKKISYIIFDLSEVLIYGLVGIEKELSGKLNIDENEILECFGGEFLDDIMLGKISEDDYLEGIIKRYEWNINSGVLKDIIRNNFLREVEGSLAVLTDLAKEHRLVLLSDHAEEWIHHIKNVHPFLSLFIKTFFSYEHQYTKKQKESFEKILSDLPINAEACLFIDDNPENISTAESLGIKSIRFENAKQLRAALNEMKIL